MPAIILDKDKVRTRNYGKPGNFRPKPYGMEYRTLSNFWINDPQNGRGGVTSDVNRAIWRALKAANISVPFPQREMRILGPVPEQLGPQESTTVPQKSSVTEGNPSANHV